MRIRLTIDPRSKPKDDLALAARIRRDLWARSVFFIDAKDPLHGPHRDEHGRAYFEFDTEMGWDAIRGELQTLGHADSVIISEGTSTAADACLICGNIAGPVNPAKCANCGFTEIARCVCGASHPRQTYKRLSGDLFEAVCGRWVRLRCAEPRFKADGGFNEPMVVVRDAAKSPCAASCAVE